MECNPEPEWHEESIDLQNVQNLEKRQDESKTSEKNHLKVLTPNLMKCSNVRFTYSRKEEDYNHMEEEEAGRREGYHYPNAPPPKPSLAEEIPKGNINNKKQNY